MNAQIDNNALHTDIIEVLRSIYDPEIPVNIHDLGLIYGVEIEANGVVEIEMTLTAPGCPVAETFPGVIETAVEQIPQVSSVHVEVVWEPPWTQDRMTEDAKLQLGLL